MSRIADEEFFRAFVNKRFWIVVFLALISFTYGFRQVMEFQVASPLSAVTIWQLILQRGYYGFFAALMAGLPFADSLLLDRRHLFINQILLRCRYRDYLSAKTAAVFCSGMAAVAVPALILLIGCCLSFPLNLQPATELPLVNGDISSSVIEPGVKLAFSFLRDLSLYGIMLALFGGVYALLGLGSSFMIRNPFVVLGFPFICYSLGYFIIPTSVRLAWLGSTEAALLPSAGLLSPVLQYLAATVLFGACLLLWSRKNRILSD